MQRLMLFIALLPFFLPGGELPAADIKVTEPPVSAQSYALYDTETKKLLAARFPDLALPVASTTKIMTAYTALQLSGGLEGAVEVKYHHVAVEGSRMYLREGETVTLRELMYGLLLASGNDAALAIAEGTAGTVYEFVLEMNRNAEALGMKHTVFKNPHGLPEAGHVSTAADMALLMAAAMENEDFAEITGTREAVFPGRTIVNHNRLLSTVAEVDGGKTGYTKEAGRCLVTTAQKNGRRLVAVTINAPSDWEDHKALYRYGFALFSVTELVSKGAVDLPLTVVGGYEEELPLAAGESASAFLTAGEKKRVRAVVYLPRFEYAPVGAGARVGKIVFTLDGRELASVPLYTAGGTEYKRK